MKPLLAIVLLLLVVGCAPVQLRTGPVAVREFSTEGFETSDPTTIQAAGVTTIAKNLHKKILEELRNESKLVPSDKCDGLELSGRIEEVNNAIDSHFRLVTITVERKFEVHVRGELRDCKTGTTLAEFSSGEDGQDMRDIVSDIAEDIVKEIRYAPKVPQPSATATATATPQQQ